MTNQSQAAGEARPLKPHEVAGLLAKLAPIKRDSAAGTGSIAMRHRLTVYAIQLKAAVSDLQADELLGAAAEAIRAGIAAHQLEAVAAACVTFELAIEGKSSPEETTLAAPIVIDVTPVTPPANDNDHDPERALPVPVRAQIEPVRDHQASTATGNSSTVSAMIVGTPEQMGEAVRSARARRRMTQQDVATAASVGRRFVVELEAGKPTAELCRVLAVCHAVGLTIGATAA